MNADARRSLARLVRASRIAMLGTLRWGTPNVSMVAYIPARDFATFWLRLSRLAWHTHDLAADARVSLAICEADDGREDPQTLARLTLRGEAAEIPAADREHRGTLLRIEMLEQVRPIPNVAGDKM